MNRSDFSTLSRLARTANAHDHGETGILVDQIYALRDQTGSNNDTSGMFDAAAMLAKYTIKLDKESAEYVREIVGRLIDSAGSRFCAAPAAGPETKAGRGVVLKQPIPKELTETRLRLVSDLFLGELLVRDGELTQEMLDKALDFQKVSNDRLGETLVSMGATTWEKINAALKVQGKPTGGGKGPRAMGA